jgi:hypothetical protein
MSVHRIALADLLANLSDELTAMAGEIEQLQDTLSGLLARSPMDGSFVEQAQGLDRATQHLAQLSQVASRAGDACSDDWSVASESLLSGVSLAALAHRLRGAAVDTAPSGEFEMF